MEALIQAYEPFGLYPGLLFGCERLTRNRSKAVSFYLSVFYRLNKQDMMSSCVKIRGTEICVTFVHNKGGLSPHVHSSYYPELL